MDNDIAFFDFLFRNQNVFILTLISRHLNPFVPIGKFYNECLFNEIYEFSFIYLL